MSETDKSTKKLPVPLSSSCNADNYAQLSPVPHSVLSRFHEPSKKTFFELLLVEKPVMRETECRKLHQKFQNSYQVMKVSKFN